MYRKSSIMQAGLVISLEISVCVDGTIFLSSIHSKRIILRESHVPNFKNDIQEKREKSLKATHGYQFASNHVYFWCAEGDLNPHALRHMALNHACLPIPAPALEQAVL
jgi:hypothetical protein